MEGTDLIQEELPGWISSSDIMSPLLIAYDGRIKELEDKTKEIFAYIEAKLIAM